MRIGVLVTLLLGATGGGLARGERSAARTAPPISVAEVVKETERGVLQINNQSPFMVILYVGEVRVGFIHPYRSAFIRGLPAGYHKLYAHSQYGTTSWGPRDTWVPGTWNLIY